MFNWTTKMLAAGLLLVGLVLGATPSDAFRMICNTSTGRVTAGASVTCDASEGFTHWTIRDITWKVNLGGQSSGHIAAITSAMDSWNDVEGSDYHLIYGGTTSAGWATDNANTILWASGNGCTGSCLALTALVLQSGQKIVESDITFNTAYAWNTNGLDYDVEAVALHEFGHSLGIHHSNSSCGPPTMQATYFGIHGRTLEHDDEEALRCSEQRFPMAPPPPPLTVSISRSGGTFTANASGGTGGYSYTWYRKLRCSGGGEEIPLTGPSSTLPEKDIPCGTWSTPYTSSPPNVWSPYGSNQDIKVVVTDQGSNTAIGYSYEP